MDIKKSAMSELKQLTQAVFKPYQDIVISAAIDSYGTAWGFTSTHVAGKTGWNELDATTAIAVILIGHGYDATDWENSLIMRAAKELTQADFKYAPDWAKSAAIDENGFGFYHSLTMEELAATRGQWWPRNQLDYNDYVMGVMTGDKMTASYADAIKFDASQWLTSAINRKAA